MTKKIETTNSSIETLLAARSFTRRVLFKGALAAGAMTAAGPYLVRDAFSSSGEPEPAQLGGRACPTRSSPNSPRRPASR
ncbi:hypothetical protein ACFSKM_26620 [Ancylobacter dichloromethanicus]